MKEGCSFALRKNGNTVTEVNPPEAVLNMKFKTFLNRLIPYIRPNIGKLSFVSVMMILASALEASIPEITGMIVDELFSDKKSNNNQPILFSLYLFGLIFASSLFTFLSAITSSWVSTSIIKQIRSEMFNKLMQLPKSYFDKTPLGNNISKFTFDVEQVADATSKIWIDFLKSAVMVIILTAYLFYKSWLLSITLVALIPLIFYSVHKSSSRMRLSSGLIQKSMGEITQQLNEDISGIDILKIYSGQDEEERKFEKLINTVRRHRLKLNISSSLNTAIVNIIIGLCLACVVYISSTSTNMTAGGFLAFFTAMAMLVKPTKNLVNINKPLQIAIVAAESLFGFLDQGIEKDNGKKSIIDLRGEIEFHGVSFRFGNNKVLKHINLKINAGSSIGIVGHTGCGKSTLAGLITRFYPVSSGRITIDGIDINDLSLENLRKNISLVDQEIRLFNNTIRKNISLGAEKLDNNRILSACVISNSLDFINKLPDGLETNIGDNGKKLSGGQRQRISIARAIAKKSAILILDEATSSLDSESESQVKNAINAMQSGKTTIIIAHRLSTIKKCDQIVVLSGGEISEIGTHQELLDIKGIYNDLWKLN